MNVIMILVYACWLCVYWLHKKKGTEDFNGLEWYKAAHVRKDGSFVTPTCEKNYVSNLFWFLFDKILDNI